MLRDKFIHGNLAIICDGPSKAGWLGLRHFDINTKETPLRHAIEGTAILTGSPKDQEYHRAECIGLLGGLIVHLQKYLKR
jgi:hypothetical protein